MEKHSLGEATELKVPTCGPVRGACWCWRLQPLPPSALLWEQALVLLTGRASGTTTGQSQQQPALFPRTRLPKAANVLIDGLISTSLYCRKLCGFTHLPASLSRPAFWLLNPRPDCHVQIRLLCRRNTRNTRVGQPAAGPGWNWLPRGACPFKMLQHAALVVPGGLGSRRHLRCHCCMGKCAEDLRCFGSL